MTPDDETLGLIERQERMLDRLYDAPPEETQELAESLGWAMRQLGEDGQVWGELEEAGARAWEVGPAEYLALVDWETLLESWGLPEVEQTALELIDAVDRGAGVEPDWQQVRQLIYRLGREISDEAVELPERPGLLGRLKEKMAVC